MPLSAERCHHYVLRQQPRTPSFGHRDVDQRHNRATQIEDPLHISRRQRQFGHHRPVQHLLDVQDRQAKTLAPAAKDAELRFRRTVVQRPDGFQHFRRIGIRRQRRKLKVFVHSSSPTPQANRRTARSSSSRVNGLVTYPSAPCCWPQYLSLAESFDVTRITGIVLNSVLPFSSRQT